MKSAIVTAIEAVTPDSQASARDVFRHVDNAGRTGMRAPDRVFFVDAVGLPNRAELLTVDAYRVQMSITVLYSVAPGKTEDRVLSDCERISHALINLAAQDADLYAVEVTPLDMFENENTIEAQITVEAIYRLTGVA